MFDMCPLLCNYTLALLNDPQTLFSWSFVLHSVGGRGFHCLAPLVRFHYVIMMLLLFGSVSTWIFVRLHWLVKIHCSVLVFSCSSASTLDILCYVMETCLFGRIVNFSVCVVSVGYFVELWQLLLSWFL